MLSPTAGIPAVFDEKSENPKLIRSEWESAGGRKQGGVGAESLAPGDFQHLSKK